MDEPWWSPREIIFSREQVLWLLKHLTDMKEGNYPPNPQGSGYTEAPLSKKSHSHKAYFEVPCQLIGEIDYRLKRTGVDGKLLLAEVRANLEEYLSPEAKSALAYISGWKRKKQSYAEWKRQRQYRGKVELERIRDTR